MLQKQYGLGPETVVDAVTPREIEPEPVPLASRAV